MISSYAFLADNGRLISFETLVYVLITRHASVLLFVMTVMSSAQVEITGGSFGSDPHFSIALVRSSATNKKRYGLVIPPCRTPLLIYMSFDDSHIFSLGVLTMKLRRL